MVALELGKFEDGRRYAARALKTIEANGEEDVDQAFLHLALVKACKGLGDEEDQASALERADQLCAAFKGQGLIVGSLKNGPLRFH
ncbi:MAG: hypothetical protein ACI835_005649 [Planctomycetota bacterium]